MTEAVLKTEIVRDTQRFTALSKEWDALAVHLATPLARHAWYMAALAALQQHMFELSVVLIWNGEILIAAAPLMLDKMLTPARLVPIDAFAGEPFRLLYRDPESLALLSHACARLKRPILFRRLQSSETDLAVLSSALRSKAAVYCKPRYTSATTQLPADFETFEASMSRKRLSAIRNKWRAATREHGEVVTEFVTPESGDLPVLMGRFMALEGSGWKQRSGTALSADHRMGCFVSQMASAFAQDGSIEFAFLKIGGRDAACRLLLWQQTGGFAIKIGFDEEFRRFTPGILLSHESLRESCRIGATSFSFLGVYEDWQHNWPHEVTEDFRVATYPFRPSGALALLNDSRQAMLSLLRRY
ncbi:GNAT family N-acetyltransferase [Sphingorhabdus pulchriflava]|uniref:GNAT family N-acetyltransferase n=1 Tax=Sphingorhabdus pulchriflava TaxID=2292257 RepID=A0A371BIB1_9SPHN|nr:GNAT family N-acetyltransferase [Sphingorhabdus pulchriflava]RDV07237.1 GNAT family N-acetyltransferase [Sphingorhabdus pulchriflava]